MAIYLGDIKTNMYLGDNKVISPEFQNNLPAEGQFSFSDQYISEIWWITEKYIYEKGSNGGLNRFSFDDFTTLKRDGGRYHAGQGGFSDNLQSKYCTAVDPYPHNDWRFRVVDMCDGSISYYPHPSDTPGMFTGLSCNYEVIKSDNVILLPSPYNNGNWVDVLSKIIIVYNTVTNEFFTGASISDMTDLGYAEIELGVFNNKYFLLYPCYTGNMVDDVYEVFYFIFVIDENGSLIRQSWRRYSSFIKIGPYSVGNLAYLIDISADLSTITLHAFDPSAMSVNSRSVPNIYSLDFAVDSDKMFLHNNKLWFFNPEDSFYFYNFDLSTAILSRVEGIIGAGCCLKIQNLVYFALRILTDTSNVLQPAFHVLDLSTMRFNSLKYAQLCQVSRPTGIPSKIMYNNGFFWVYYREGYKRLVRTLNICPYLSDMILEFTVPNNYSLILPAGSIQSVHVNWGDGSSFDGVIPIAPSSGISPPPHPNGVHMYSKAGVYQVTLRGVFSAFSFGLYRLCSSLELTKIISFGNIGISSYVLSFQNCKNLTSIGGDFLAYTWVEDYCRTFAGCSGITGRLPEFWMQKAPAAIGTECFMGCVNAENFAEVPADWR